MDDFELMDGWVDGFYGRLHNRAQSWNDGMGRSSCLLQSMGIFHSYSGTRVNDPVLILVKEHRELCCRNG